MSSTTVTKRAGGVLFEALTWLTTVCCLHVALVAIVLLSGSFAFAQTPSFTYQGRFTDGGTAANGVYDMQFKLFDSSSVGTGNQLGTTITNGAVAVVNGVFTVQLNFGGAVFSGPDRFLEIAVRAASSSDPYTVMSPRQQLTSSVYAIRASSATSADTATNATTAVNATNAANATNSAQLGGIAANQYVLTTDPRLTISGNFIQNTTSQQASSNFNISCDGTAGGVLTGNTINSATHYDIAGNRVFAVSGAGTFLNTNTVAGVGAGTSLAPTPSTGNSNSFFGSMAGNATFGGNNSFFGAGAGRLNNNGANNSFFGWNTGSANLDTTANSFFGASAGASNTHGGFNSFFGEESGRFNLTGVSNTFIGYFAGGGNTTGNNNIMIGDSAGTENQTGSNNILIGTNSGLSSSDLTNAIAIGYSASVAQSNSMVLGNAGVNVGIGTSAPQAKLHLSDNGVVRARINSNTNAGVGLALAEQSKWSLAATGVGDFQIYNDALNQNAIFINTVNNNIGVGTTVPNDKLEVNGLMRVDVLGSAGATQLCRNANDQIATCSSSLRYKKDLQPFTRGLALLNQLKPISFKWKSDNSPDLGFGAEDVAQVEPLLVTRNDKGEVEGVKYDRLSAVLVNAVKEQQQQIAQQQEQIKRQENEIKSLKLLVCQRHRHAALCE